MFAFVPPPSRNVMPPVECNSFRRHPHQLPASRQDGHAAIFNSTVTFSISLERPSSFFLWKLLLPLGVVILMGLAALLVSGESTDVRIALPSTALLAAVFLQLTYTEDLPTVTGLVLMDGLYAISYLALAGVLARVIYASYDTRRHSRLGYSTKRGDLITLGVLGSAIVIGMILVSILSP